MPLCEAWALEWLRKVLKNELAVHLRSNGLNIRDQLPRIKNKHTLKNLNFLLICESEH